MNEYVIFSIEYGDDHTYCLGHQTSFFAMDPPQAATHIRRWLKSSYSYSFRKKKHIPSRIMVFITIMKYIRSPNTRRLLRRENAGTFGFRI